MRQDTIFLVNKQHFSMLSFTSMTDCEKKTQIYQSGSPAQKLYQYEISWMHFVHNWMHTKPNSKITTFSSLFTFVQSGFIRSRILFVLLNPDSFSFVWNISGSSEYIKTCKWIFEAWKYDHVYDILFVSFRKHLQRSANSSEYKFQARLFIVSKSEYHPLVWKRLWWKLFLRRISAKAVNMERMLAHSATNSLFLDKKEPLLFGIMYKENLIKWQLTWEKRQSPNMDFPLKARPKISEDFDFATLVNKSSLKATFMGEE